MLEGISLLIYGGALSGGQALRGLAGAVVAAEASGPGGEMAVGCHVRDKSCSKQGFLSEMCWSV